MSIVWTGISIRYPATELVTVALCGAVATRVPTLWAAPAYFVLAAGDVALTVIDLGPGGY
ncbi:MAG: hypothetical protein JWO62_831 [Acidimicrobiaceae bacterium]|jgi:uncharacterized MnhB-related membrane protein|nr:hypothetical protein [Acidimicrobiaceae bacterium]